MKEENRITENSSAVSSLRFWVLLVRWCLISVWRISSQ